MIDWFIVLAAIALVAVYVIYLPVLIVSAALFDLVHFVLSWKEIKNIPGRVVFITGCDSGFGHSAVSKLLNRGFKVFAGCLTQHSVDKWSKNVDYVRSGQLVPFQMDITKQSDVDSAYKLVQEHLKEGEGIWALINNAGISAGYPDAWLSVDDYHKVMEVNFFGHVRVTHAFMDDVRKVKGRVIFTGSSAGWIAMPDGNPYCVSKSAVLAYAKTLRDETDGIRVVILTPGFHETPMTSLDSLKRNTWGKWKKLSDSKKHRFTKDFVEKRLLFRDRMIQMFGTSSDVESVVNTMVHAVCVKYPRWNYWIGYDAQFGRVISALPETVLRLTTMVCRRVFQDSFETS